MAARIEKSWLAALSAAVCLAVFTALLFAVARSFRLAIADIAESETRVTVVNTDGSVLYDSDGAVANHADRAEIARAFADGRSTTLRHSDTMNRDFLYCAHRVGDRVVRLPIPYTGVRRSEALFWAGLGAAVILGACVVFFVYVLTRRLAGRLEDQARRLEIASANETFRREFTANVTHELKSPLTAILGAVEMLGDGSALSEEERKELYGIIRGESGRLGSLVGDVLSLAQIEREQGEEHRNFIQVPLEKIVDTVAALEAARAKQSRVTLAVTRCDHAVVNGDPHLLEQVIVNLVENAFRYSGTDRVDIALSTDSGLARISVTDYGIGIPAESLPHIFKRFYRVDKARSRSLGGTGLGLAIVKHIAILHGGNVSVQSTPGDKTVFTVELPLA